MKACGVLAVDDYGHAGHYTADLVLNQNLHAREELYQDREAHTRLLLGNRFALLRCDSGNGATGRAKSQRWPGRYS